MMEERHYAFFRTGTVNIFPAMTQSTRRILTACSATAHCTHSDVAAAAVSAIRRTESRTVPAACSRTGRKITTA